MPTIIRVERYRKLLKHSDYMETQPILEQRISGIHGLKAVATPDY